MGENAEKFLSKGPTILGIAATARAHGISTWQSLGPALRHPVAQLLAKLQTAQDTVDMADAARHCLHHNATTGIPDWLIQAAATDSGWLESIGNEIAHCWPPDTASPAPCGAAGGRTALAIAFCRNRETAQRLAEWLDVADATDEWDLRFWDLISLAAVLSPPGIPSRLRARIKALFDATPKEEHGSAD
ncbi:MAG: hypothetical protein JXX29_23905 [Deltaproteobacteria bacterium]|nr:hypothetical protein [Deltaproteobacteria bacterium]MBN2674747.1 hypothetical protein [Deltaproteobacteria bacterium]